MHRVLITLTLVNLALLLFQLARLSSPLAAQGASARKQGFFGGSIPTAGPPGSSPGPNGARGCLLGDSEPTYILLNAQGAESSLKLISDGRQQLVKPGWAHPCRHAYYFSLWQPRSCWQAAAVSGSIPRRGVGPGHGSSMRSPTRFRRSRGPAAG